VVGEAIFPAITHPNKVSWSSGNSSLIFSWLFVKSSQNHSAPINTSIFCGVLNCGSARAIVYGNFHDETSIFVDERLPVIS
jgi:hypothetical protein